LFRILGDVDLSNTHALGLAARRLIDAATRCPIAARRSPYLSSLIAAESPSVSCAQAVTTSPAGVDRTAMRAVVEPSRKAGNEAAPHRRHDPGRLPQAGGHSLVRQPITRTVIISVVCLDVWQRGRRSGMGVRAFIQGWPVYRQLTGSDPLGRGTAAASRRSETLRPRIDDADRVAHSVCPYCAVGCAQKVYVKDEQVVQIEGNPDSPISRGRLCPKGSASKQLVTGPHRQQRVLYRAPYATDWTELELDTAMDMVADRVLDARDKGWQDNDPNGDFVRRTLGLASLGGATLDNEENYLIKKLFTALGAIQIENQARI
jgi:formate dehydrogenase major subunit